MYIRKSPDESLGVKIVSGTPSECFPFGANNLGGVYVVYVNKSGPADKAGLKIGHRILEINDKMVDPSDKSNLSLSLLQAGDNIKLRTRKHAPPKGFLVSFFMSEVSIIELLVFVNGIREFLQTLSCHGILGGSIE